MRATFFGDGQTFALNFFHINEQLLPSNKEIFYFQNFELCEIFSVPLIRVLKKNVSKFCCSQILYAEKGKRLVYMFTYKQADKPFRICFYNAKHKLHTVCLQFSYLMDCFHAARYCNRIYNTISLNRVKQTYSECNLTSLKTDNFSKSNNYKKHDKQTSHIIVQCGHLFIGPFVRFYKWTK